MDLLSSDPLFRLYIFCGLKGNNEVFFLHRYVVVNLSQRDLAQHFKNSASSPVQLSHCAFMLSYARPCVKCFSQVISFNPPNNPVVVGQIFIPRLQLWKLRHREAILHCSRSHSLVFKSMTTEF